jgi:aquaporin Z
MMAAARHWPEYLMEALLLGVFMVVACAGGVLLEHPSSSLHRLVARPLARRALMGLLMGCTATTLIYSPLGKQSGAHMNPAVTLGFLALGRIQPADAAFYTLAQIVGGMAGVFLARRLLRRTLHHPAVNSVATPPGPRGRGVAFAAEFLISCLLFTVVLITSNSAALAPYTGLFAGVLVAFYITFEAPLSGMSMNPARTLASASAARSYRAIWIYFTAPPLGMLAAAALYTSADRTPRCAKLDHSGRHRCIFCESRGEIDARHESAAPAVHQN